MTTPSVLEPAAILTLYRDRVYSLILRLVGNRADAEDVAQIAFLKAFRSLHLYDPRRPMISWLFKIAHNASLDFLRAKGLPMTALDDPDNPVDPADAKADVEKSLLIKDRDAAIRNLVESLPPLYKEILLLRHQEDLDYKAIGDILQLPEGTVKIRLFRARNTLKEKLEAAGLAPEQEPE